MPKKYSFILLSIIALISLLSFTLLDNNPIVIKYNNQYFFPAFFSYNYNDFNIAFNMNVNFNDATAKKILEKSSYVIYPLFGLAKPSNVFILDILVAIKYVFYFGIIPTAISLSLGLISGVLQGYRGAKYDFILHRIYEVIISIPTIYLLMLLYTNNALNHWNIIIIFGIANYGFFLIYIRKITFLLKSQAHIINLEALHISDSRIMFKYLSKEIMIKISPLLGFMFIANNLSIITLDFFNMEYNNIKTLGGIIFDGLYNNKGFQTIISIIIFIIISLNILNITKTTAQISGDR